MRTLVKQAQHGNPESFIRLIRILINNCNKIFNHNKKSCSADSLPEAGDIGRENSNVEFMELLLALPSDSRLIFQLYYGEQYTTREIAAILHMNESTVKSRLHRGKEHLKAQLQGI